MSESYEDYNPNLIKRSSDFVMKIWEEIEQYLILSMGMSNFIKLYCTIDNEDIVLSIEDENSNNILNPLEQKNKIIDKVFKSVYLSFDIHLIVVNSLNDYYINIDDCNYYIFPDKSELDRLEYDDGTIFLEARVSSSIQSIEKLKIDLIRLLCRESQYAVNDIILKKSIDNNFVVDLDAKIEQIIAISKIKKSSFAEAFKKNTEVFITDKENEVINNLIKKGHL